MLSAPVLLRRALPITLVLGTLMGAALPGPARADPCPAPTLADPFVCTPVRDSDPCVTLVWQSRCIPYAITSGTQLFAGDERRQLIAECWRAWTTAACTDLEMLDVGYTDQKAEWDPTHPENELDTITAIEDAADARDPMYFEDPAEIAITLTRYSLKTGELFDADILINAYAYRFVEAGDPLSCQASTPNAYDLRNTLTHEMGHFLGFDHTRDPNSTMYPTAQPCEIKKRTPNGRDLQGICHHYAKGQPSRTCFPPEGGYDVSDPDPKPWRNQCDRFHTGTSGSGSNGSGSLGRGCACTAEDAHEPATWVAPWIAAALLLARIARIARIVRRRAPSGR